MKRWIVAVTALAGSVVGSVLVAPSGAQAAPFNVGNRVWRDVFINGVQDPGELGVAGVTVQLLTADRKQLLDETTTDASGVYTLVGDSPGAFRIRVLPPDGWSITQKDQGADDLDDSDVHPFGPDYRDSDPFTVATNLISSAVYDIGLTQSTGAETVGNFVWNDLDGDGVQDGGEPGVANVVVELWNAPKTERLATTTTSPLGIYAIEAPNRTLVRIRVLPPAGMELTRSEIGSDEEIDSDVAPSGADRGFSDPFFPTSSSEFDARDAGLLQPVDPVTIGDRVWRDDDLDGIQDPGEVGLAGVAVQLWNATRTQLLDTAVTGVGGTYTLEGQRPGGFQIRVVAPSGYQHTRENAAFDDSIDSDVQWETADAGWSRPFFLGSGVASTTSRDAGLVQPGEPSNIGNRLWLDLDYDGVFENGEASVQGATVELWNAPKTQLLATTTTDASGLYTLTAQRSGFFRIRVPLAANSGVAFTLKDAAGDDLLDSDVHAWGDDYGFSDPIAIAPNLAATSLWDAGLLPQQVPEPNAAFGAVAAIAALIGRATRAGRSS